MTRTWLDNGCWRTVGIASKKASAPCSEVAMRRNVVNLSFLTQLWVEMLWFFKCTVDTCLTVGYARCRLIELQVLGRMTSIGVELGQYRCKQGVFLCYLRWVEKECGFVEVDVETNEIYNCDFIESIASAAIPCGACNNGDVVDICEDWTMGLNNVGCTFDCIANYHAK